MLNSKMIGKRSKKSKLNSGKIRKMCKKSNSNNEKDMKFMEETQVEYRKYLEKYGRKSS